MLIVLGAMYIGTLVYHQKCLQEVESLHLSYAIDLCSDAAAYKMMDTDSINTDYSDQATMQVNPQVALNTFVDLFCFNYGMYPNETNRQLVMNKYIPNLTVAGWDGFYMAQPACISDATDRTQYSLVFTPKLPYKVAGSDGNYYALNMGANTAIKLQADKKSFVRVKTSSLPKTKESDLDLREYNVRQSVINNDLTHSIGTSVNSLNAEDSKWKNEFFVPGNLTTFTGVNPVTGPSILALVQNVDLLTGKKANAFSITGSKLTTARLVVGYKKEDGNKYYCYADKLTNGDGSPIFPFLQFDKKTQRYLYWEFPEYKYKMFTGNITETDLEKLRHDSSYVLPNQYSQKFEPRKESPIMPKIGDYEIKIDQVFNSPKEAAEKGYMYDALIMRSDTDEGSSDVDANNIKNISN